MNTASTMEMVRRSAPITDQGVAALHLDEALGELLAEVVREPRERAPEHTPQAGAAARRPFLRYGWLRPALIALALLAVLTAVAVPPVRAAIEDLGQTLVDYLDGSNLPGRSLESSDNPPAWLLRSDQTDRRVIASAGPFSLYLSLSKAGDYNFGLDSSVGIGGPSASWEARFADNAVVILGPGTVPKDGRLPLYGVTAGNVAEVELQYADGSTTTAPAQTGGFVLLFNPFNDPSHLVALDAEGTVVQTVAAHRYGRTRPRDR